ncbi:hypothetical protein [Brevirhabdus sp.]|uniref:hypothetical protein n=1 Tax=Brevirhabdus sp. TaxID=2004514 RepID=UPI004057CF8A
MRYKALAIPAVLLLTVAACDTDLERGVVGAGIGAAVADATDNNVATGAAIGAAAGVFCDDAGVCRRR